jgi:hypothetical protein
LRLAGTVLLLGSLVWLTFVAYANEYARETEGGLSTRQHFWNSVLGYGGAAAAFTAGVLALYCAADARRSLRPFALVAGIVAGLLAAWIVVINSF